MNRVEVESSNVKSVGYSNGVIEVEFKNGTVYRYYRAPKKRFKKMLDASSCGKFLNKKIKGRYRYERVV